MRIVVTSQHRFARTPDQTVWTDAKYGYSFWRRYLDVFAEVRVLARVRAISQPPERWQPVSGDGVTVAELPFVRGAWGWMRNLARLRQIARTAVGPGDAVMLRVPGETACCLDEWLIGQRRPYGIEVVGDPRELFAPGAVRSVFRPFLRAFYPRRVRRECAHAACAAYVTRETLQRHYPPPPGRFTTHYSSIELGEDAFVSATRDPAAARARRAGGATLLFIGTFEQLYKGPDIALQALALCHRRGLAAHLRLCGDGRHRGEMEQLARQLGLAESTTFLGQVPSATVRAELDAADLFISPSRQEGLPRAVIEALARGVPTIASAVGGTAELLPADELIAALDVDARSRGAAATHRAAHELAEKISTLLADDQRLAEMSARNLQTAGEYRESLLRRRRREMYQALRAATERWLAAGAEI